ncbi:uncharacterized protein LOC119503827 [Sebastes umbrosus]|uniref:uncharacterized protein LOC119503827 n=1 Tax=Sebastes umbrosus TaxID=72105 RepID=UPI0018A05D0E|nr:uncharacterized protein LOC119503827 [Sebastes umbrosus]
MNLWLSSHFLVAGLFLSSSALTPEECQPLVTPLSLAVPSVNYGRWNFIVGYSDNEGYNEMLKVTESSWMTVNASQSSSDSVVTSHDKMNGTCFGLSVNATIDGNTASISFANISSVFHLLPTCDGCMLMNINSTVRDLDKILRMMNIISNITGEEVKFHALYLMAREPTLKDSDMEHFKKQASCLGFSRKPDFLYDHKNDFCAEDEGTMMPF